MVFDALLTRRQELIENMTLALDSEAEGLDKRREQTDSNAQGDRNVVHTAGSKRTESNRRDASGRQCHVSHNHKYNYGNLR